MTNVRREKLLLLWRTVRETALATDSCFTVGNMWQPSVCRRSKLPERGVHSDNVRAMQETSQKRQTSLWIKLSDYSRERDLYYWGFEDKPKCVSWKYFSGCVKKISKTQRAKN